MSQKGPQFSSLVKYDNAVLLSESKKKQMTLKERKGAKQLPPVENKPQITQTEDILNSILPPKEWEEDNQKWVKYVSSTPATRLDVIALQEELDTRLQQRQARETGICPVREELYNQCFDELIRQVTVTCTERGLLLLRVRDELKMRLDAYRTLYESSVAFGMRKALQAEQGKSNLEQEIRELKLKLEELEEEYQKHKAAAEADLKREQELRHNEAKEFQDQIAYLKKQNAQLKQQLDNLTTTTK